MKKATIYILFVAMIVFGAFFAIYSRQPLGFAVVASASISIIYFLLREDKT
jgi:uncharacterized MnhB-related membrane protein